MPVVDLSISSVAAKPKKGTVDGVSFEQHPLPELIAAEEHLAAKSAGRNPAYNLTFLKLEPPGTA